MLCRSEAENFPRPNVYLNIKSSRNADFFKILKKMKYFFVYCKKSLDFFSDVGYNTNRDIWRVVRAGRRSTIGNRVTA